MVLNDEEEVHLHLEVMLWLLGESALGRGSKLEAGPPQQQDDSGSELGF